MGTVIKTASGLFLGVVFIGLFRWILVTVYSEPMGNALSNQNKTTATQSMETIRKFISDQSNAKAAQSLEMAKQEQFLASNPDVLDMPPWEHENKWHKVSNKAQTCWFHKKSLKKICKPT